MATLLKVLNNLADTKSAGSVALRLRTQARLVGAPEIEQGADPPCPDPFVDVTELSGAGHHA